MKKSFFVLFVVLFFQLVAFAMSDEYLKYNGTYLPSAYIVELKKTKSHKKASKAVKSNSAISIVFKNEKILRIFNFHEGVDDYIVDISESAIKTKLSEFSVVNDGIIVENGVAYERICGFSLKNSEEVGQFISKTLIGKVDLKNAHSSFITDESGMIKYDGNTYCYGVSLVFASPCYDEIESADDTKYIEILDNKIRIYNAVNVYNEFGDYDIFNASYELENEFCF